MKLYEKRSVAACIEAIFDFMRINRSVWFRTALALFLTVSVAVSLVLLLFYDRFHGRYSIWHNLFWDNASVYLPLTFVGLWVVYVQVYSLLNAYIEHGDAADRLTLREMLPYMKGVALRALMMPVVPVTVLCLFFYQWMVVLPLLVVLVPLALLPSLVLLEGRSVADAFGKSVNLGFASWFHSAAVMAITMALGFYISVSFQVPEIFLEAFADTFTLGDAGLLGALLAFALRFVLYVLMLFGLLVMLSVFILGCAFEYGSVSEEVDATSVASDVENFENL